MDYLGFRRDFRVVGRVRLFAGLILVAFGACLSGCVVKYGGDGEIGFRCGAEATFFHRTISEDEAYIEVRLQPATETEGG